MTKKWELSQKFSQISFVSFLFFFGAGDESFALLNKHSATELYIPSHQFHF